MDALANLQLRMNLWTQAVVLECLSLGVLACIAAFIGILQADINILKASHYYSYSYYTIPGDSIWMLVVSLLSLFATGYFLITQQTAKLPDYQPVTVFFSMGVTLTAAWFTSAVSLASNSISGCIYYSGSDLCVTGGLADALAWFSFAGFLMFSLTIYAVGKKAGSWNSWNQNNVQMGAVPVKATQGQVPNPQQPYSQQPYSQQPYSQQSFPASPTPQPQQLYSQQSFPQQPYPQQPYPQQPYSYPQQPYPVSPTPPPQQLYSQQSFPASPVQSLQQPFAVSPGAPTSIQLPDQPIPNQHPPHTVASQSFDNSPALPDQIYHEHPPNEV